jgi:hypothetical protein
MIELNTRVGAIQSADKDSVHFFGWGNYVGDEVPCRGFLQEAQIPNPCIVLDSGKKVYGFECWWGDAAKVEKMIDGRTIIDVIPGQESEE